MRKTYIQQDPSSSLVIELKTIRIKDKTHAELSKIKGELTKREERTVSYDDAIAWLIEIGKPIFELEEKS